MMKQPDEQKPLIIVVSRYWPTALSVIRSLGTAGYTVDLIASVPKQGDSAIAAASKYTNRTVETVFKSVKREDDPNLLAKLQAYEEGQVMRPVLFPTDDYTASFIDRHRDQLEKSFVMPGMKAPRYCTLTEMMNKHTQNMLAGRAGLPVPREWCCSLTDEIRIPDGMVYPCFCKPVESFSGFKGEMKQCDSPRELEDHLLFLKNRNPFRQTLIQEYLDIEEEINLCGVCTEEQIILPALIRKAKVAKHERGVAVAGRLHPMEELGGMRERIEVFLRATGYIGMFDMDLHKVGETIYFGELNLRSGGTSYAYYLGGVNLPAITVKTLLGERIPEEETHIREFGKTFAYEKVLWKEYVEGYLSKEELKDILHSADEKLISDDSDSAPGELFHRQIKEQLSRKRRKKLRRYASRIVNPVRYRTGALLHGYPQMKPWNARNGKKAPRVMVIGRNYSSNLCMVRSLGMAGYEVEVLRIVPRGKTKDISASLTPEAYSKYVKAFYTCPQKSGRIAAMLKKISDPNERMLLIPTEDVAAYIVDEHYDELRSKYHLPDAFHKQGGIIRLMSKQYQKQLAREAGVPILDSQLVRIRNGRFSIPEGIGFPCFIKPDISRKTSKTRMRRCDTKEELHNALEEIAETIDLDVLVEEYCEIKRELSLLGLSYEGSVVFPGLFEATDGGHGSRRGVAATGISIDCEEIAFMSDSITRFLKESGYNGLFDIDLIETVDGRTVFIELNLRYGASGYVLTKSGINLPGLLADRIIKGIPIKECAEAGRVGVTFVSEKVLFEEYADGNVTIPEIHDIVNCTEVRFIQDELDPKPYRCFARAFGEKK